MAGFDAVKAREAFAIPEGHEPVDCIAMGYPVPLDEIPEAMRARDLAPRVRKPLAEFVHLGGWDRLSAP